MEALYRFIGAPAQHMRANAAVYWRNARSFCANSEFPHRFARRCSGLYSGCAASCPRMGQ